MDAVRFENISKKFGNFYANKDINFAVKKGEIHAVLGENGAGKSTLMNMLFGLYTIDEGKIYVDENPVDINNPIDAGNLGIGMVHQHFKLVDNFTVLENIVLGQEPTKFGLLKLNKERAKVVNLIEQYNFNLKASDKISSLTVGQQQKVEILKVLYKNSNILVFDEPTGVLTPKEVEEFLNILLQFKAEGKTIILITHKLNEIKKVADQCTIIRKGETIKTINVSETTEKEMANLMVGREINLDVQKTKCVDRGIALEIKNLNFSNKAGVRKLKDIKLNAKRGMILGIAGVDGNGQKELIDVITGLQKKGVSGEVLYHQEDNHIKNLINLAVKDINKGIVSHIPEDRQKYGLVLDYTIGENAVLINYFDERFSKNGLLNKANIGEYAQNIIDHYDVRSSQGIYTPARELSGGNQQKLIIGRQIEINNDIIVAYQPTRGVDVGAIEFIHQKLLAERDKGKCIILVSLELNEIFNLSDEIAVMHSGEIVDVVKADNITREKVGLMMAGEAHSEK